MILSSQRFFFSFFRKSPSLTVFMKTLFVVVVYVTIIREDGKMMRQFLKLLLVKPWKRLELKEALE